MVVLSWSLFCSWVFVSIRLFFLVWFQLCDCLCLMFIVFPVYVCVKVCSPLFLVFPLIISHGLLRAVSIYLLHLSCCLDRIQLCLVSFQFFSGYPHVYKQSCLLLSLYHSILFSFLCVSFPFSRGFLDICFHHLDFIFQTFETILMKGWFFYCILAKLPKSRTLYFFVNCKFQLIPYSSLNSGSGPSVWCWCVFFICI